MSTDGADSTAIDAGNITRHFSFSGEEDTTFKVVGFTLKNVLSSDLEVISVKYIKRFTPRLIFPAFNIIFFIKPMFSEFF